MTTPRPVQTKYRNYLLWGVSVTAVGTGFFFCTRPTEVVNDATRDQTNVSNVATTNIRHAPEPAAYSLTPAQVKTESVNPAKSFQELIQADDLCGLDQKVVKAGDSYKDRQRKIMEVEDEYFKATSFEDKFKDYRGALGGKFNNDGRTFGYYPRFLAALRKVGWVIALPPVEGKEDFIAATRELTQLAYEDKGNAAPAAFAIAVAEQIPENEKNDFTESERAEIFALLESAARFDSYFLGFAREITKIDDARAVSLTIRIGFLSTCAIADWNKFRTGFVKATENRIELRLKVTDLMMANAKEAKGPSLAQGYSVMDTSYAKAIAGGARQYPTFREIDDAFPGHLKTPADNIRDLLGDGDPKSCSASQVQRIRDYLVDLKRTDSGLGIAL